MRWRGTIGEVECHEDAMFTWPEVVLADVSGLSEPETLVQGDRSVVVGVDGEADLVGLLGAQSAEYRDHQLAPQPFALQVPGDAEAEYPTDVGAGRSREDVAVQGVPVVEYQGMVFAQVEELTQYEVRVREVREDLFVQAGQRG
jgi:hypothetical protein